jgi:hypothetical protein
MGMESRGRGGWKTKAVQFIFVFLSNALLLQNTLLYFFAYKVQSGQADLIVKGKKMKLSPCLTDYALHHDSIWGSGRTDPGFIDLSTSWR